MANYNTLKQAIQDVIRTNGNNEITGALLQQSLLSMINSLGAGYQFIGIANTTTNPGTPDPKIVYISSESGTYSNFGGITIEPGEVALLIYITQWGKITLWNVASKTDTNQIKGFVNYANADIAGKRNAPNCVLSINLFAKDAPGILWVTGFQYISSLSEFWIQLREIDGTAEYGTLRIPIAQLPTSGVQTYSGYSWNKSFYCKFTIDWGRYSGGFATTEGTKLCIWHDSLNSDAARVAMNQYANVTGDIETIQRDLGKNLFDKSRVGYIDSSGGYNSADIGGIVTYPQKVQPGQSVKFVGGWQNNATIGLVWGYSDENLSNPTKLVGSLINVNTTVVIPDGVNYIMAWSLENKNPVINNADSALARVTTVQENAFSPKTVLSHNLFNKKTVTPNTYVNYQSGNLNTLNGYDSSDYIPVKPNTTYSQRYSQQLAFYNSSKVYISGVASLTNGTFTTPSNAAYVRICNSHAQTENQQVNEGTTLFDYDEYGLGYAEQYMLEQNIVHGKVNRIVATRNAANYNSIREIMRGITDASEMNRYVIFVPNGEWFECDLQGKKYVSIVGEDKEKTILYCDGTSTKLTPVGYSYSAIGANVPLNTVDKNYKHVIFALDDIDISNLSIIVNDAKYCVHLDATGWQSAKINNCHLVAKQNVNYVIGVGIRANQSINVTNSILERTVTDVNGLFLHNWNNQDAPSHITFDSCLFRNCGFALIDELGSEQDDQWNITNCYSDAGGTIAFMVDKTSDGKTYWINPATGQKETDPTAVPYCIHLNCLGSNVGKIQVNKFDTTISRPKAAKYIMTDYYIAKNSDSYNIYDVVYGYASGSEFVIGNNSLPFVGVVESIVDGIAYIAKKGNALIVPLTHLYGATFAVGSPVYKRTGGYLTTSRDDSDGVVVGVISGDYYGTGRQIVLW